MTALSCAERISNALKTTLEKLADQYGEKFEIAKVNVERNRRVALDDADLPILVLFEGEAIPSENFSSEDGYDFPFAVQAAIQGSGDDAASRANALRADLLSALYADRTLGGLARDLEVTGAGDWLGCDPPASDIEGFMLALTVTYATRESDPYFFENE